MTEPNYLQDHLARYRANLRAEVPPFFAETYATLRASRHPNDFAKVGDELRTLLSSCIEAARTHDDHAYEHAVKSHRVAMLQSLIDMVEDGLDDYYHMTLRDVTGQTAAKLSELLGAKDRGWQWFKYAKIGYMEKYMLPKRHVDCVFIPRYSQKQLSDWQGHSKVFFDATEIGLVFKGGLDPLAIDDLVRLKMQQGLMKILKIDGDQVEWQPLSMINSNGRVDDWSLPLSIF